MASKNAIAFAMPIFSGTGATGDATRTKAGIMRSSQSPRGHHADKKIKTASNNLS